jgi:hypothetical protein
MIIDVGRFKTHQNHASATPSTFMTDTGGLFLNMKTSSEARSLFSRRHLPVPGNNRERNLPVIGEILPVIDNREKYYKPLINQLEFDQKSPRNGQNK